MSDEYPVVNEAAAWLAYRKLWMKERERVERCRAALEDVVRLTPNVGDIGTVARRALRDLEGGDRG